MRQENFNRDWRFRRDEPNAPEITVNLPHDAMLREERIPKLKDGSHTGYFPGGKYRYSRKLFGDKRFENKTVMLEFEGVYMKSQVFLNGEPVGGRIYGYSQFYCDLSDRLRIGEDNDITVFVDNSQTQNSRWYSGSGIYREVNLWIGEKQFIEPDGLRVTTQSIAPARLLVDIKCTKNPGTSVVTDILYQGEIGASGQGEYCEIEIPEARLWDVDSPELYDVRTRLIEGDQVLDEASTRTGIRSLDWNGDEGLLVNGNAVKLRGGCIHHDHGPLGACSFRAAEFRKIRILKSVGFNAVRIAHNPANSALLDACDELGLFVMNESFDTWRANKASYDYGHYFDEEWERDLSAMVLKSINHPSVIMYCIGNEIIETGLPEGAEISRQLHRHCKALDPSRPTTNAINPAVTVIAGKTKSLSKRKTSPDDIVDPRREEKPSLLGGSVLINIVVTLAPPLMKWLGSPRWLEAAAKESIDAVDIVGYNYGAQVYEKQKCAQAKRLMVAAETFPSRAADNWRQVETLPYLIGDFQWTAWDYLGEAGAGVPAYGKEPAGFFKPYPCISAGLGSVDLTGDIGAQAYYTAVAWGQHRKPYIAVRPVHRSGEKCSLGMWRATDAVHSWSWPGQEGRKAEIEVFGRGHTIELLQDGRSLGKKRIKACKALFKARCQPGELTAILYDEAGAEIGRDTIASASEETRLTLEPETTTLKADGMDLAYIPIHITDRAGIRKMLPDYRVTVSVSGAASLAGLGSGNPITEESFFADNYTTWRGRVLAVLRSNGEAGPITVTVSAEGLASQTLTLEAQ